MIRIGIGGWLYAPWRGTFYPDGLAQSRELSYASARLDIIEINSTYYRAQTPSTFAKWREETPDGFMFSVKAPMFATNRKVLADAGPVVEKFVSGGVAELGPKLGPVVWEFAPTKPFDADDFGAFVAMLPEKIGGMRAMHVLDVRHPSFRSVEYLKLARNAGITTVFTDADDPASFADITGSFIYARVKRASAKFVHGFKAQELDRLAARAMIWASGGEPDDVPRVEPSRGPGNPRPVFMLMISGDKQKAPAAATALRRRLSGKRPS